MASIGFGLSRTARTLLDEKAVPLVTTASNTMTVELDRNRVRELTTDQPVTLNLGTNPGAGFYDKIKLTLTAPQVITTNLLGSDIIGMTKGAALPIGVYHLTFSHDGLGAGLKVETISGGIPEIPAGTVAAKSGVLSSREATHLKRRAGSGLDGFGDNRFEGAPAQTAVAAMLQPESYNTNPTPNYTDAGIARPDMVEWIGRSLLRGNNMQARIAYFFHILKPSAEGATSLNGEIYSNYRMHLDLVGNPAATMKDLDYNTAIDNQMGRMLNNNQNGENGILNENYGRELLEIHSIGKDDPQLYTEDDVRAISILVSGWKNSTTVNEYKGTTTANLRSMEANPDDHIWGPVTFSNTLAEGLTIQNADPGGSLANRQQAMRDILQEGIDMIYDNIRTAEHLTKRLHWLAIGRETDNPRAQTFIKEVAKIMKANDYNIHQWLTTFFTSEYFYEMDANGVIHKGPLEFMTQNLRITGKKDDYNTRFIVPRMSFMGYRIATNTRFYNPDDAFGYLPSYKPGLDENWHNAEDTKDMQNFGREVVDGFDGTSSDLFLQYLNHAPRDTSDNTKPTQDEAEIALWLFERLVGEAMSVSRTSAEIDELTDDYLLGNGDVRGTWAAEYQNNYVNGGDATALESRLARTVKEIMRIDEYFYY